MLVPASVEIACACLIPFSAVHLLTRIKTKILDAKVKKGVVACRLADQPPSMQILVSPQVSYACFQNSDGDVVEAFPQLPSQVSSQIHRALMADRVAADFPGTRLRPRPFWPKRPKFAPEGCKTNRP